MRGPFSTSRTSSSHPEGDSATVISSWHHLNFYAVTVNWTRSGQIHGPVPRLLRMLSMTLT